LANKFSHRIALLDKPEHRQLLKGMRRGLEKESLRTDFQGHLAMTPHSPALGSPLTHSAITTDFSEALLEFITPVCASTDEALESLDQIHRFTYSAIGDEQLWTASMPCLLPEKDEQIPLAQYGSSNSAKMKTLYRRGLGHRYGRSMQTIAGIHYNVSFPHELWDLLQADEGLATPSQSYINRGHFGLIRNFRRYTWLLLYLFGASPAICNCFVRDAKHRLQALGESTLYLPDATCLRMGDLGYRSAAQRQMNVCFNTLDSYINTLKEGITSELACAIKTVTISSYQPRYCKLKMNFMAASGQSALLAPVKFRSLPCSVMVLNISRCDVWM
jgi:glutamate--cysteine ligase